MIFPLLALGPVTPAEIRIVSYNIRHGAGMDDKLDLDRTATVLKRLNPDLVGLQEVDNGCARSGGVDQAQYLGRKLAMHPAFGKFMDYDGGEYGMAILSRYPIQKIERVRLPDGNEPRIALRVESELPDGRTLSVVNVHLDWVRDDKFRYAQAQALRTHLQELESPYVLMGDFNDVRGTRTLATFSTIAHELRKEPLKEFSFPANNPKIEIDHIFTGPINRWSVQGGRSTVIEETQASDHRPVLASVAF